MTVATDGPDVARPLLSAHELKLLCELLYARTGMTFGESKRYYLERRVADRMARSGEPDPARYLAQIVLDGAEMEALINAVTINETYFYREDGQLATLVKDILPIVVAGRPPGALVRIWSMPCATGEEPYSIAIWLLENWPMVDAWHVDIVGSDIDTAVIEQARRGRYGERALQRLPEALRDRYFGPVRNHQREIIDDLKESVRLGTVNLIDPASMAAQGTFDVIFCRNLLIYFDEDARRRAAANLAASLNPGGFLCLGHTESMARISDRFEPVRFSDGIVYRRP